MPQVFFVFLTSTVASIQVKLLVYFRPRLHYDVILHLLYETLNLLFLTLLPAMLH